MTIIIQSHTYTINLDNVCYFRATDFDQTIFTTKIGRKVRITCPYEDVVQQIKDAIFDRQMDDINHRSRPPIFIQLDYPVRDVLDIVEDIPVIAE